MMATAPRVTSIEGLKHITRHVISRIPSRSTDLNKREIKLRWQWETRQMMLATSWER